MKKENFYRKKKGSILPMIGGFLFIFVILVFLTCGLRKNITYSTVNRVDDGLKGAVLSGATADLKAYGLNHDIVVTDTDGSYARFLDCFKTNLGLADDFSAPQSSVISSNITIDEYTIYNVRGNDIEIVSYSSNGVKSVQTGTVGSVETPNHVKVTTSTIYSAITFSVHGLVSKTSFLGKTIGTDDLSIHRDSCVDIATN